MFQKSRLFFWTIEILAVTAIILLWTYMSEVFTPFVGAFQTFVIPFIIGGFLYYVFNPLVTWLEDDLHVPRLWGTLATLVLLVILVVLAVNSFIPNVIEQLNQLINSSQDIYTNFQQYLSKLQQNPLFENINIQKALKQLNWSYVDILQNVVSGVTISVSSIIGTVTSILMAIVIAPIFMFYLLKDGKTILPFVEKKVLKTDKYKIVPLLKDMNTAISHYIFGVAMNSLFIFVFSYLGYMILGIRYALIFALILAFLNVIPYIGPYLGLLPVIIAYAGTDFNKMLIALIYVIILQQIDGMIIYPRVVGGAVAVHPLTIMVLLVIGSNVAGLVGMIVVVPVYAILKEIVKFLYRLAEERRQFKLSQSKLLDE